MNSDRLKFRVWDVLNNRYDKGEIALVDRDGTPCYADGTKYCNGEHNEDFVIEQCTGLRDAKGVLIYEGDCIKSMFDNLTYVVEWNQLACRIVTRNDKNEICFYAISERHAEIVGNVHEGAGK